MCASESQIHSHAASIVRVLTVIRYFVLSGSKLMYHATPSETALGCVELDADIKITAGKTSSGFNIETTKGRAYQLEANSPVDCREWVASITAASRLGDA